MGSADTSGDEENSSRKEFDHGSTVIEAEGQQRIGGEKGGGKKKEGWRIKRGRERGVIVNWWVGLIGILKLRETGDQNLKIGD